jgi:hypothetical protein
MEPRLDGEPLPGSAGTGECTVKGTMRKHQVETEMLTWPEKFELARPTKNSRLR